MQNGIYGTEYAKINQVALRHVVGFICQIFLKSFSILCRINFYNCECISATWP